MYAVFDILYTSTIMTMFYDYVTMKYFKIGRIM